MEAEDERSLIQRAKKDPEAFGILFERHYPATFAYVFRPVKEVAEILDLKEGIL